MAKVTNIIDRMPGEVTDLALHVNLCEQRYVQLISKFDQVDASIEKLDERLDKIEQALIDINQKLSKDETGQFKMYLTWAGVLITGMAAALGHYLLR